HDYLPKKKRFYPVTCQDGGANLPTSPAWNRLSKVCTHARMQLKIASAHLRADERRRLHWELVVVVLRFGSVNQLPGCSVELRLLFLVLLRVQAVLLRRIFVKVVGRHGKPAQQAQAVAIA